MKRISKGWSEYHVRPGIKLLVVIMFGIYLWTGFELFTNSLLLGSKTCITTMIFTPALIYTFLLTLLGCLFILVNDSVKGYLADLLNKLWLNYLIFFPTVFGFGTLFFLIEGTNIEQQFCAYVSGLGLLTEIIIGSIILLFFAKLGESLLKFGNKDRTK